MAAYVDYTFYTDTYGGTAVASADFTRLALQATAIINTATFGRATTEIESDDDADLVEAIKLATCAVADEIQNQVDNGSKVVISEKVGNLSQTYAESKDTRKSALDRQLDAAKVYLGDTGLMYGGFYSGEYGGADADEL